MNLYHGLKISHAGQGHRIFLEPWYKFLANLTVYQKSWGIYNLLLLNPLRAGIFLLGVQDCRVTKYTYTSYRKETQHKIYMYMAYRKERQNSTVAGTEVGTLRVLDKMK